jgi:hypothetical protein
MRQNMDDTDSDNSSDEEPEVDDTAQPWLHEWALYTTTHEVVPENVGIVQWWGVRNLFIFYIAWADVAVLS